ncbi:MAG: SMP-30/gluconolactonase/LRE family protein [Deltaproteobacteria bacterium]|nr:SMP-30/gluconolactonase/LRE family protein [Deltaproteobacteria bacterium]
MSRYAVLVLAAGLAGCPSADPDPDPTPEPTPADICADSMAAGSVRVFATGFTGGTEGITFSPDGRLFVSRGDVVEEVWPNGQHEEVAAVPAEVGLTWWNGELIVASGDAGTGDGVGGIYAVDVDSGDTRVLATGIPGANFPAVTPWDTLLVSTPGGDEEIVEVSDDGDVSLWTTGVSSPNGIGFAADGSAAYVASTFVNPAPLWEVPIEEGVAGTPTQLASWGPGVAPDGVAMGQSGAVYIAQNLAGRIDRVDPATGEESALAEGVQFAASAAFGVGDDWDPCAIYVTSLFSEELYVVGAGEPGQGMP